jgi:ATP-dependent Lon protease
LFYNNARSKVGLVGFWDIVAFDEVAGIRIRDQDSIQIMKDYMANGRFSRGVEVIANASLAFVGNIDYAIAQLVNSSHFDLFYPLPDTFDLAVMDRFYTYLPGWEVPKNNSEALTGSYGFITDYLAEAFHHLFMHTNRYDWVNKHVRLGSAIEGRDEVAIKKTLCAMLKLLHPTGEPMPEELDEYVEYAVEGRRRVKEQLNKRKSDDEYARINLSYFDHTGTERVVFCEESKGSQATLVPKRKVIDELAAAGRRGRSEKERIATSLKPAEEAAVLSAASPPVRGQAPAAGAVGAPAPAPAQLQEQHYKILYGSTGYTYERIFGSYLLDAKGVEVEDPYIRSTHQLANFIRFCELLVKVGTVREVRLITGFDSEEQRKDAKEKLDNLAQSLLERDIKLVVAFKEKAHDREVRLDNGWRVKIGRGLDIYQPPENWFVIGANDLELRPCLETMVDVFRV